MMRWMRLRSGEVSDPKKIQIAFIERKEKKAIMGTLNGGNPIR